MTAHLFKYYRDFRLVSVSQKLPCLSVLRIRQKPLSEHDAEQIEREKRTYGTPAFEHNSCTRLPMIDDDGEWDVMAEAVVLDSDHTVDAYTIEKLQDDMIMAMDV